MKDHVLQGVEYIRATFMDLKRGETLSAERIEKCVQRLTIVKDYINLVDNISAVSQRTSKTVQQ